MSEDKNSRDSKWRKIRSFVLREGRLTQGQKRAMDEFYPQWGIPFEKKTLNWDSVFQRESQHVCIEIGFGMGTSLAAQAKHFPEKDYLGVEVHRPGVGACLLLASENESTNLRVVNHDAVEVIEQMVADGSVDSFQVFFPDPWHKRKHHKRRIIQPEFVTLLTKKLKKKGVIHLATDWQDYAVYMLKVLSANHALKNLSPSGDYVARPESRPITKFEKRGHRLGHGVWDLMFEKK